MTQIPETLVFVKYMDKQHNNKTKKKEKFPAAFLCLPAANAKVTATNAQSTAENFSCGLYSPFLRCYSPEKDDIASAWSGDEGLAINVRGEKNVERLEAIYNAFRRKDIVLVDASFCGFLRSSMALVIGSKLPADVSAKVLANDQAAQRLQDAVQATGIEAKLKQAGRNWYALSPRWDGEEGGELSFFLNRNL